MRKPQWLTLDTLQKVVSILADDDRERDRPESAALIRQILSQHT